MKTWYMWLVLSGIWALAAVLNYSSDRSWIVVGYNIYLAVAFCILGFVQRFCEKRGLGKKTVERVAIIMLIIAILFLVTALVAKRS